MKQYTWGDFPCVRAYEALANEAHPCYYCGTPLIATKVAACDRCRFEVCPKCGKCYCMAPQAEQVALRVLRDKYCCTLPYFQKGFDWKKISGSYSMYPTL